MSAPIAIIGQEREPLHFSIATLVTKPAQHSAMIASFRAGGFDGEDTEYLFVDNSRGNVLDGYSGLSALIAAARGRFIILVHQDVLLLKDGRKELLERLAELDQLDPNWALAGNAGGTAPGRLAIRISDPHGENQALGPFPARAAALDENFIVLRRSALLSPSRGLAGFHLYGADLCLQARFKGMTAYVVDFHLRHLGVGTVDRAFRQGRDALERAYHRRLKGGLVQTNCDLIVITGGPWWLIARGLRRVLRRLSKLLASNA